MPVEYSAPISAHELGHAHNYEHSLSPTLKAGIEGGARWGGRLGEIASIIRSKPGLAALTSGLANLPNLVEEGRASLKGYKALKESGRYTPEELAKSRGTLLRAGGTYLAGSLADVGSAALMALPQLRDVPPHLKLVAGMLPGQLASHYLYKSMMRQGTEAPRLTSKETEALKKQMELSVPIHRGSRVMAEGGGAAYVEPDQDSIIPFLRRLQVMGVKSLKHKGTDQEAKDILRGGGVLLPVMGEYERTVKKWDKGKKKTAAKDDKPDVGKRIKKKLKRGLISAAIAAPIAYAALGKRGRSGLKRLIKNRGSSSYSAPVPRLKVVRKELDVSDLNRQIHELNTSLHKKGSAETLPHEKLAMMRHWSSVAAALVK